MFSITNLINFQAYSELPVETHYCPTVYVVGSAVQDPMQAVPLAVHVFACPLNPWFWDHCRFLCSYMSMCFDPIICFLFMFSWLLHSFAKTEYGCFMSNARAHAKVLESAEMPWLRLLRPTVLTGMAERGLRSTPRTRGLFPTRKTLILKCEFARQKCRMYKYLITHHISNFCVP